MGDGVRLSQLAMTRLPDSGVSNPVTAVLLNYRAYDTLLELAVVLAAVLGVVALGPARRSYRVANPVLFSLIRWLVPLLIVTSVYLLWVGAHAPGGAFQAGATLAAAGILLRLGGFAHAGLPGPRATRWLLVAGVAVFFLVGLWLMRGESAFLQYPQDLAGALILVIEAAATLSIATALTIAYIGGRPASWETLAMAASPEPTEPDQAGKGS
jgi:multisubunit Na+/H+ antiporter MnhB subunit